MDDLPLTITDFAVLGIVFLSGFLAYLRGAVREFFFLATWAVPSRQPFCSMTSPCRSP